MKEKKVVTEFKVNKGHIDNKELRSHQNNMVSVSVL